MLFFYGGNMQLKINKEIKNYTESIFFGLTMRQFCFAILACLVAVIIYFLCIDILGLEITSWLCILGALPFATLGFITFQSMNAEQIFIIALRSFILSSTNLKYKSSNLYLECLDIYLNKKRKEVLGKNDKKLFKFKKEK